MNCDNVSSIYRCGFVKAAKMHQCCCVHGAVRPNEPRLSEWLGIGMLPNTPRHQCLAYCELAAQAHNAHPQKPIPKGSDSDDAKQPARRADRYHDCREASAKPYQRQERTNDTDGTWRLISRSHMESGFGHKRTSGREQGSVSFEAEPRPACASGRARATAVIPPAAAFPFR